LVGIAERPTNTVFGVTGNNIRADSDLARRLLEIRLHPAAERRTFKHPDMVRYVRQNRSRWIAAALAILRGSQEPQTGHPRSVFHQWDRAMRGGSVVVAAEVTRPLRRSLTP
jgi:hypothetical protein